MACRQGQEDQETTEEQNAFAEAQADGRCACSARATCAANPRADRLSVHFFALCFQVQWDAFDKTARGLFMLVKKEKMGVDASIERFAKEVR